jgi:hypothetical protein
VVAAKRFLQQYEMMVEIEKDQNEAG